MSLVEFLTESVSKGRSKGKYAKVSLDMNQYELAQVLTDIGAKEVGYSEMKPGEPTYYFETYTSGGVPITRFVCNTTDKYIGFQVEFHTHSGELTRVNQCNTKSGDVEIDRFPWVNPDESLELLQKMIGLMQK